MPEHAGQGGLRHKQPPLPEIWDTGKCDRNQDLLILNLHSFTLDMPKKPRPPRPDGPPPLNNKDHLERANYAIQASLLLRQLGVNRAGRADEISTTTARTKQAKPAQPTKSTASVHQLQPPSEPGPSDAPAVSTGKVDEEPAAATTNAPKTVARSRKRTPKGGKEPLGNLSRAEVTSMRKWTVHNQVKL